MNGTIFHRTVLLLFGLLLGMAMTSTECLATETTIRADSADSDWRIADLPVSEVPLQMETESQVQTSPLSGHGKISSRWHLVGFPTGRCHECASFARKRNGVPEMSRNDWTIFLQSVSLQI